MVAEIRELRTTISSGDRVMELTGDRVADLASVRNVLRLSPMSIPPDMLFEEEGMDFLPASGVKEIAQRLIANYPEFDHLEETEIAYAWKRKGGESGGKVTFGKCVKSSGLVKFFGKNTFVIWLAADNCREYGFTAGKLEALIYHELCHAGEEEAKNGDVKAVVTPHDVEAFASEIERYGLWTDDLVRIKPAFDSVQSTLPGFGN